MVYNIAMRKLLLNKYTITLGVIAFLLLLIISPIVAYTRIYTHVTTTSWGVTLLWSALFLLMLSIFAHFDKRPIGRRLRFVTGILSFFMFLWVYGEYGFLEGAYFLAAFYLIRMFCVKLVPHLIGRYGHLR